MRKSVLLTLEFPPQKGGTQKYYADICNNLPDDKIAVLTPKPIINYKLQTTNYKIYRYKLLSSLIYPHWLPMLYHLWRVTKKEKIELIQVGQVLPCGTAALIINKVFKIPYIVYTHGLDILGPVAGSRKQKLMRLILSEAESVVSNSSFVKKEVVKLGVERDRVVVVYPSMETRNMKLETGGLNKEELLKKYNLQNKKILLTVCRLVDRKGVDLVITALAKIASEIQNLVYVVIGDGPQAEALRAQRGLLEPVPIFTGKISDEELAAWYQLADVFILTPKKTEHDVEGFGIVYLEANSYGKPVIGSRVGGVVEAVEDGVSGILVEPDNVEEIGRAVVKLFGDDELRNRLGRQGKDRAEKKFKVEEQVRKIKNILS